MLYRRMLYSFFFCALLLWLPVQASVHASINPTGSDGMMPAAEKANMNGKNMDDMKMDDKTMDNKDMGNMDMGGMDIGDTQTGVQTDVHSVAQTAVQTIDGFVVVILAGLIFYNMFIRPGNGAAANAGLAERTLFGAGALALLAIGLVQVWILADQTGSDMHTILATTMLGRMAWLRPAIAAILIVLAFAPEREGKWTPWVKAAGALALIAAWPLTGHAYAASESAAAAVIAQAVQMTAAAVLLGGLAGILIQARSGGENDRGIYTAVRKFSGFALPSILLAAAGAFIAAVMKLQDWPQLSGSRYGLLTCINMTLLLILLILAAYYRLAAVSAGDRAAQAGEHADRRALRRLLTGLRLELAAAMLLIAAIGLLSMSPLPDEIHFEPLHWHVMGTKAHMTLQIKQKEADDQFCSLAVWLPTGMGAPAKTMVTLQRQDGGGPVTIPMSFVNGGPDPYGFEGFDKYTYSAEGAYMKRPGTYAIHVEVTDNSRNTFKYDNQLNAR